MSKRDLKKYLKELPKEELEAQVIELYNTFKEVKTYYNFVFNPKEDKLLDNALMKIKKEYFPTNGRKPKMRRSVAQKIIKHYIQLGVDINIIAEIMTFNLETTQAYRANKFVTSEAFYKSLFKSYQELVTYVARNGIESSFTDRLKQIQQNAISQDWPNKWDFEDLSI